MLQNNYDSLDFERLSLNFNLNMINLANLQTDFISRLPVELNKIAMLTDKISNLNIIAGNCYLYKKGNQLKELESTNVIFDKDFNSFKLRPALSYTVEPRESKNSVVTDKKIRIYDKDKTKLKNIDDLLIRNETVNLYTEENNYNFTLKFGFNTVVSLNNILLNLNDETVSYPNISAIYFINTRKEREDLKILNDNAYSLNLDLYKNSNNNYSLDLETAVTDNLNIVFEDNVSDLIIDNLKVNYMEYNEEGEIILEALKESKPILKIGIEAAGDLKNVDFSASYDKDSWYPLDLSNIYNLEKTNKVLSFNTISKKSLKSDLDIKTLYLKMRLKAKKSSFKADNKINKSVYTNSTLNLNSLTYDEFSLYENSDAIYYGKTSSVNIFDFKNLYNLGEYLTVNNNYFIKGFAETPISKSKESSYTYSPVSLKSKPMVKTGDSLSFENLDISTKELYNYSISKITRSLLESQDTEYVLPLKKSSIKSKYYISQNNKLISIDLSLGYISSCLDVLITIDPESPAYLLDSFKNLIAELPQFEIKLESESSQAVVSLLDSNLFEELENLSKTFPLTALQDYEIGLLDSKIESINLDKVVSSYVLKKSILYTEDKLSETNFNYSTITSTEEYKSSIKKEEEVLLKGSKQIKLLNTGVIKGSIKLKEKS